MNRSSGFCISDGAASYVYRPDGLRESKTVNGVTTFHSWDMNDIVADIAGGTITTYLRGIGLIFADSSVTGDWYYQKNARGDVVQILNTTGPRRIHIITQPLEKSVRTLYRFIENVIG